MYYMLAIILFYRFSFSSVVSNKTYFVRNLQRQISKPVSLFPRTRKRKALTHIFVTRKNTIRKYIELTFLRRIRDPEVVTKVQNKFTEVHHKYEMNMFACNPIQRK